MSISTYGPTTSASSASSAQVGTAGVAKCVVSITIAGGSDAATLIVYDNAAASGTVIGQVNAAAGATGTMFFGEAGRYCGNSVYAAVTGTTPDWTVVYREDES